jgi:hypothetical protein
VQWLDLTSHLWPPLLEFPLIKTFQVHYDHMVKYFKPCFNSFSKNYYWFVQYIDNDNGDVHINQPSLGMEFKSFHFASYFFVITFLSWYFGSLLILTFVYSWFRLLFANYMTMFATFKGRK